MFKLNLTQNKQALSHLLSINENLVFADGVICAVHPGLYAFGLLENLAVKIGEPAVFDCSLLKDVVKSKEITKLTFDAEKGKAEATEPYKFSVPMKQIDDQVLVEECEKRYNVLQELEEMLKEIQSEEFTFTDSKQSERAAICFNIKNGLFLDMVKRVKAGKSSDIEVLINGDGFTLRNNGTGAFANFDRVHLQHSAQAQQRGISVITLENCQNAFESAFISKEVEEEAEKDKSKVVVVDESFLVIINRCATIINSTVG